MAAVQNLLCLVGCVCALGARLEAQQAGAATPATARDTAADSSVVGRYDFSFVPANGEPITGRLTLSLRRGRFYGVTTSPKLSAPLDADFVHVTGTHVETSSFGGGYTFAFDVTGKTVRNAVFTKTLRGVTERGELTIRKIE